MKLTHTEQSQQISEKRYFDEAWSEKLGEHFNTLGKEYLSILGTFGRTFNIGAMSLCAYLYGVRGEDLVQMLALNPQLKWIDDILPITFAGLALANSLQLKNNAGKFIQQVQNIRKKNPLISAWEENLPMEFPDINPKYLNKKGKFAYALFKLEKKFLLTIERESE